MLGVGWMTNNHSPYKTNVLRHASKPKILYHESEYDTWNWEYQEDYRSGSLETGTSNLAIHKLDSSEVQKKKTRKGRKKNNRDHLEQLKVRRCLILRRTLDERV